MATQALVPLSDPDGRTFGISSGFGLCALILAALDITGPATIALSSWSLNEIDLLKQIAAHKNARGIQLVIDRGFIFQNKHMLSEISRVIGHENIRQAQNHTKIAVLRGEQAPIVIRGSMNISANPRAEDFDACRDPSTADFFSSWFSFVFDHTPAGLPNLKQMRDVLKTALGGGISETAYGAGPTTDYAKLASPPAPIDPATLAALMAPPKPLTLL